MIGARAHFPSLCMKRKFTVFSRMCPVSALVDLSNRGMIKQNFLHGLNKKRRLTQYLQHVSGIEQCIAPYALRIWGRTWLLTSGMDRQFVDFLGTWKSPEASARYFRAAPAEVLRSKRDFYLYKHHKDVDYYRWDLVWVMRFRLFIFTNKGKLPGTSAEGSQRDDGVYASATPVAKNEIAV